MNNNKRDWLKILDVSANVLGTIGTILIAVIGFRFTQDYNNRQEEIAKNTALTSVIEFIDEGESEAIRKNAYNIIIRLGYTEDFSILAADYPNDVSTKKLIDLLEDKNTKKEDKEFYRNSLTKILDKAEQLRSRNDIVTTNIEKNLNSSTNIIAQKKKDTIDGYLKTLSERAENILRENQSPKKTAQDELGDLWIVIFGSYPSKSIPPHDKNLLEKIPNTSDIRIYQRDGKYRLVAVYEDQATAREALIKAQKNRQSAYLRNLGDWCPPKKCTQILKP